MRANAGGSRDRGSALLIALTVVVIVLGVVGSLFLVVGATTSAVGASRDSLQAFYVAEAGLNDAYNAARENQGLTPADVAAGCAIAGRSFGTGGGTYSVTATLLADGVTIRLYAVGLVRQARRAIEGLIVIGTPGPISYANAAYAGSTVALSSNGATDSWNSAAGSSLATQLASAGPTRNAGAVAAVGAVWLDGTLSMVHGNATPGQSGPDATNGFVLTNGANPALQVTGATGRNMQAAIPRDVLAPAAPPSLGAISLTGTAQYTLTGTVAADSITLNDSSTLKIVGPATVVVSGTLGQYDTSNITFDTSAGAVQVYSASDVFLQGGSTTVVPEAGQSVPHARDVNFYMTGQSGTGFVATVGGPLYATVYSSYYVKIGGSAQLAGAAIGKWVNVVGNGRIYFDEDLLGRQFTPTGPRSVTFGSWRDVP